MAARGATVKELSEAALPAHARRQRRSAGGDQCAAGAAATPPFRQELMKALRSAPLSALALASALQVVILPCWAWRADGAAVAWPFRHELMKALRSAPFLPVA